MQLKKEVMTKDKRNTGKKKKINTAHLLTQIEIIVFLSFDIRLD